jgi:hypothetical protein
VCPTLFPVFPRGEHSPPRYSRRRNPVCHSASDSPPRPPPCSPTRRDRGTEPTSRAASPSAPPRRRPSASHLALSVLCVLVPVPNQPPPQPSLRAVHLDLHRHHLSRQPGVVTPPCPCKVSAARLRVSVPVQELSFRSTTRGLRPTPLESRSTKAPPPRQLLEFVSSPLYSSQTQIILGLSFFLD